MRRLLCRSSPLLIALWCASALAEATPPELKVAFIGDQGLGPRSAAVLELIAAEGAHAVVHAGDFDYVNDPAAWDAQIDAALGPNFPYFALIGNHDDEVWDGPDGYQAVIAARMQRIGIPWDGDLGVKSAIRWQGLHIVMTAPGIFQFQDPGGEFEDYIEEQYENSDAIWRISSWHKLMNAMQVGAKPDETGWGVYEASRKAGAIVATAHEHSYSRTHLMSDFDDQEIASTTEPLVLAADDPGTGPDEGRTFAFVSGLAGDSIRNQVVDADWWASVYTGTQNANDGALFAVFHTGGNPRAASFYFKDVDGNVPDAFTVVSTVGDDAEPACGDGIVQSGEQCDDGNTVPGDGCDALCQDEPVPGFCGDGEIDAGEECDDGNTLPGDGCNELCEDEVPAPACGDGILQAGEQCDDGNTVPGDGCDALCQDEPVPGFCGDGEIDAGEECDDGNTLPGDGCNELCEDEVPAPACGDGILQAGEQCDDGNTVSGDGCDALCRDEPEPGFCGDGEVDAGEACDDGNTLPGDGCSELCEDEVPAPACGDGILQAGEQCDDGNTADGDGCSAFCTDESAPTGCTPAPAPDCRTAAKASLSATERKTGREKWKAKLSRFEADAPDFGDPLTEATAYDLCVYTVAGTLAGALTVDRAGDACGAKGKPCFQRSQGGWRYRDPDAESDGTTKLTLDAGAAGKSRGKALWHAANHEKRGHTALPPGLPAALAGASSATLQLRARGAGCFEAALPRIQKNDEKNFRAKSAK